jgi:cellulose synthase (UDP-forming)
MRFAALVLLSFGALTGLAGLACIQTGMALAQQIAWFSVAAIALLAVMPGKTARLFFVSVCAWVVIRYLAWRVSSLNLEDGWISIVATLSLLLAEFYGATMMLLGLFVNAYPMERRAAKLPKDETDYPTVDVYIPTYSESVSVVGPTVMGALEMDYPAAKFKVYVLDDGYPRSLATKDPVLKRELAKRAEELKALCARHGAYYLTRANNQHAKSGNMNSAMKQTGGELILVLDADHVPTTDFLRNTVGFFARDRKLAFVQTPHFFLNADPVEKNLSLLNKMPGENDMFYRVVQKGLDLWNTSFFCGSAAVLRREAIEDVGGFSWASITEDASTSVKMHQKGWRSVYFGKPMVAGLQPETFAGFIVQRLRWAMGMGQIFMKQNPWLVRGLTLGQRVCYSSVVLFWLFPLARILFFIAPLFSIFGNISMYPVGTEYFFAYTAPYLAAVLLSTEKIFGRVRRILTSEMYETLQAFYTGPALLMTLFRPNSPSFKVTPKGEKLDHEFISEFSRPFYFFYAMTTSALGWGIYRYVTEPANRSSLTLSVVWLVFNFVLLSAALGTLLERRQRRARPRATLNELVTLTGAFGQREAIVKNASETGAMLQLMNEEALTDFCIQLGGEDIPVKHLSHRRQTLGAAQMAVAYQPQNPLQERLVVKLAYGNSDRWEQVWKNRESSLNFVYSALQLSMTACRAAVAHLAHLYRSGS